MKKRRIPKRDIPRAVLLSLTIQGLFCYLIEYFAANYFMNSAYSLKAAKGSAAPIGDMMADHRQRAARRPWTGVHADRGADGVPGADRHDA